MPELLEGLVQLAHERNDALQRASRELTGEPEGFLIVTREVCKYVDFLYDLWEVAEMRLHNGGLAARQLLHQCDRLVAMSKSPEHYLALVIKVWHERNLPAPMAQSTYDSVHLSQKKLNALLERVHKTREWAAAPPRISTDLEELKQRVRHADENNAWLRMADVVSQMRHGVPSKEE